MEPIMTQIHVFVTRQDRHLLFGAEKTKSTLATFIVDPDRPNLMSISTPWFVLWLNRRGVTEGLSETWTEPGRAVTVRPFQRGEGALWAVVDIDVDTFPAKQISALHESVASFLSMVNDVLAIGYDDVFEACVPRPRADLDRDNDWPLKPLRSDGAA